MQSISQQSKRWCFTINHPTADDYTRLNTLGPAVSYLIFSDEVGEQGTPHIQGFVIFSSNKRFVAAKRDIGPRCHLEVARGTSLQASNYCQKPATGDSVGSTNIVIFGSIPNEVGKTNRYELFRDWIIAHPTKPTAREVATYFPSIYATSNRCMSMVDELYPCPPPRDPGVFRPYQLALYNELIQPADGRTIQFIVDPHGNSGKSWFVQSFYRFRPNDTQVLSLGKRDDLCYVIDDSKSTFLFDIPRSGSEFLQFGVLEQLKNGFILSNKYQGRMKVWPEHSTQHVVVFMNEYPNTTALSADRYKITVWHYDT